MTDYEEEQRNELEALESIYPEELEILKPSPCAVFKITLTSQFEDPDVEQATCTVEFSYVEDYPDTAPQLEIVESENLEDEEIQSLEELMKSQTEENLGMVMVFTLLSAAQEELSNLVEARKKRKDEELAMKKKREEELEQKKFEGTRVTIENFLAWKTKFDAEMSEIRRQRAEVDVFKNKLSGRELFMKDSSMNDSDVKFLQSEGETVAVDESLFQDMDDLELDDDSLGIEDD